MVRSLYQPEVGDSSIAPPCICTSAPDTSPGSSFVLTKLVAVRKSSYFRGTHPINNVWNYLLYFGHFLISSNINVNSNRNTAPFLETVPRISDRNAFILDLQLISYINTPPNQNSSEPQHSSSVY